MKLLVTAGNTLVPIDRVRCITNIFSGRTGAGLALHAHERGHDVTLLTSHPEALAGMPKEKVNWRCFSYRTFADLEELMEAHIARAVQDAVIHCAAAADYQAAGIYAPAPGTRFATAQNVWENDDGPPALRDRAAGKVKSDEPELWLRLVRTPKLIDRIRTGWKFRGLLVKFKLEVDVTPEQLLDIAERSRQHSAADWMVANLFDGALSSCYLGPFATGYEKVSRADLPARLLQVLEARMLANSAAEEHHG